jgi:hypothetical protein
MLPQLLIFGIRIKATPMHLFRQPFKDANKSPSISLISPLTLPGVLVESDGDSPYNQEEPITQSSAGYTVKNG